MDKRDKRLKIAPIAILLVIAVCVLIYIIFVPKKPTLLPPRNVEGVFPGGEAAYIKTWGMVDLWGSIKETNYYKSGGYKYLSNIPPIFDIIKLLEYKGKKYKMGSNPDILMNLLGYESALGVYVNDEGGRPSYLFVSIVHPNFLFMERLFFFFDEGKHSTETAYIGLPVVEIDTEETGKIQYILDGDFLIVSDNPDIFERAVARYIDGDRRPKDKNLRLLGRETGDNTIISGFVYPERFGGEMSLPFPFGGGIRQYLPEELVAFTIDYEEDDKILSLEARGGLRPFPIDKGGAKEVIKDLKENELFLVSYKGIPIAAPPFGDLLIGGKDSNPESDVIDKDFFAGLFRDRERSQDPGIFVFEASNSLFNNDIEEMLSAEGYKIVEGTKGGKTVYIAEMDGVEEYAWGYRQDGDIKYLVLGRDSDSVADMMETLPETAADYIKGAKPGVYLNASPKKLWDEISMSHEYYDRVFNALVLPHSEPGGAGWDLQSIEGLYPVQTISAFAGIDGAEATLSITMEMEDKVR